MNKEEAKEMWKSNKYVRVAVYAGSALLILYIGGKVMKVVTDTVINYKDLKEAINS